MDPISLGLAGAGVVGNILGGNAKKRAAKRALKKMDQAYHQDQARAMKNRDRDLRDLIGIREADQAEMQRYARSDEERMRSAHREGIGYDLERLRDEASAAGFNPLTVLQNTGAANYAVTPEPVLTTPFVPRPFIERPTLNKGSYLGAPVQGVAQTAGYVGDAIAAGAGTLLGISQESARLGMEREILAAENMNRALDRAAFSMPRSARVTASPAVAGDGIDVDLEDPGQDARFFGGLLERRSGTTSSAAAFENNYGEVFGELFGASALATDFWREYWQQYPKVVKPGDNSNPLQGVDFWEMGVRAPRGGIPRDWVQPIAP